MVEIKTGVGSLEILENLGAKPSKSEERGLALIDDSDLLVFSPGISSAGFAEIRMAKANNKRKIIATTIDEKGLSFAEKVIDEVGLSNQIETRLEDLRAENTYPDNSFDVIYARLVLHYLSSQDLENVLADFHRTLKSDKKLFIVVRSVKNIPSRDDVTYDEPTKMTTITHYKENGEIQYLESRYLHTPESICDHLSKAGFKVEDVEEYQEQLYKDFMRKEIAPTLDHVIEVQAIKVNS
jgi:cyclopropane fatty-acyl-phospholipid synthase-like methyltransferase